MKAMLWFLLVSFGVINVTLDYQYLFGDLRWFDIVLWLISFVVVAGCLYYLF